MLQRTVMLSAYLLTMAAAGCVPPEPASIAESFPDNAAIADVQREGRLRVGVPDMPPWSMKDGGFLNDVAAWVAGELRVDLRLVRAPNGELVRMAESEDIDLAFPPVPITERRIQKWFFARPYYVSHQRLLVAPSSDVAGVHDLDRGDRVCQSFDDATGVPVASINDAPATAEAADPEVCLARLKGGTVDAVAGPSYALLTMLAREPDLVMVGENMNTEGYGPVVAPHRSELVAFVGQVLAAAFDDGRWHRAHARWLAPLGDEPAEIPELTATEAAALFPAHLDSERGR